MGLRLLEKYIAAVRADGIQTNKTIGALSTTAVTAGGAPTAAISLGGLTTGPNFYFGSGAPTVTAPQGSVYFRTDGSSTSTRMYINTNGSTTWTAVTTAA